MPQHKLVSHIDHAIPALPHTPMYLIHKWWARKPHNVVSQYIQNYSKEGEIVLDPFSGSGVTAIEAIKLGRKAVAVDLDPIALFISKMTAIPVAISKIESVFCGIKDRCEARLNQYYTTKCIKCHNVANTLATIWDREKNEPIEIRYYCDTCQERNAKGPDANDIKKIQEIEKEKVPFWYPDNVLRYSDERPFKKKERSESIEDLFTKRNLICLSILLNEIEQITDQRIREIFLFAFTSMVHLASRMCPVAKPGGKGHWSKFSATSFWALQSYWVPPINMESNVWMLFNSAVNGSQGIINGKTDSNNQIKLFEEARDFQGLKAKGNIIFLNQSSLDLSNIPSNSIDYVFTDPPYGGAVQYFELSTLWCAWLNKHDNFDLDYNGEITINENQGKSFDFYHNMLKTAFQEVYRVLKEGKYLTVTFHNTDIEVYNSIHKAAVLAGFDLEKVVYQPPARPSAKQFLQPFGSAIGDYYIRFRKPERSRGGMPSEEQIDKKRYERIIVDSVKKVIAERGEPTQYSYIINSYSIIYNELKKNGYLFSAADRIDAVLKKNLNEEFVLVPKKDEKGKTLGQLWWFKNPESIPYIERVPLSERVEKAVINVLNKNYQVKFDDILQEIFIRFPNSLTPETSSIDEVLREYAEPVRGGKWRLKPIVKDRENEHDKIIEYLCQLGEKAGYQVYGDVSARRKTLSLPVSEDRLARIREIDALWYKGNTIHYEFEVENSTGITEAIVRGTNIDYSVHRLIIIPEERENLLARKVKEPILAERIVSDKWMFVRYDDFYSFYHKNKGKKKIQAEEIEKLNKWPKTIRMDVLDKYFEEEESDS